MTCGASGGSDGTSSFSIWVDADSCPVPVRDMILRFASRLHIKVNFVANRPIPFPPGALCTMTVTEAAQDAADNYIADNSSEDDIAITRDIPLAARLVEKKVTVLNDRGTVYTETNIKERLSLRNFAFELYQQGIMPERTASLGKKEITGFANSLDREIQKRLRKKETGI